MKGPTIARRIESHMRTLHYQGRFGDDAGGQTTVALVYMLSISTSKSVLPSFRAVFVSMPKHQRRLLFCSLTPFNGVQ